MPVELVLVRHISKIKMTQRPLRTPNYCVIFGRKQWRRGRTWLSDLSNNPIPWLRNRGIRLPSAVRE